MTKLEMAMAIVGTEDKDNAEVKRLRRMTTEKLEAKYNEEFNNTDKEDNTMTETTFVPATERLPETEEKHTAQTTWEEKNVTSTKPVTKKTHKPSKLTAVRENMLEAFLNLLPSTPWTYTTRNKKPVLDLRINDGKKIMVIIRYSNRGVQVMSKVEFPGSETHEKWSHPYAVMAKTAEEAIQTLTAIQTAIDQQEAEKKAKAEAKKAEETKAE